MSLKINFLTIADDDRVLELFGPIIVYEDQSYVGLRCLLEEAEIVEWPFQFWDVEANCTIKTKLEKFKKIGLKVFVIPTAKDPSNGAKRQKVGTFGSSGHVTIKEPKLGYDLDLSIEKIPPTSCTISVEGSFVIQLDLKSITIPQEIMGKYLVVIEKIVDKNII
jgi:hypothetical protein